MDAATYRTLDGVALGTMLRTGETDAGELLDLAVARCEDVNPALNAVCYPNVDGARERGAHLRGVFGAVPFLLKDTGLAAAHLQGSVGSRLLAGLGSTGNANLTRRFAETGLVPFARTTVPEFCMAPTTEAVANGGPTRNPWDLDRSCGGSSGGAAVAVATGIVPVAHGSDGGGSIRIPASCCGVFGLKPSRGLIPVGPGRGEVWSGLAVDGVLSRSVRDTAAALDGIAGMELGAPYAAPPRPASYLDLLERPFERPLRIARWRTGWEGIDIAPDCQEAVDHTAALLTAMGHEVVDTPLPPIKFGRFMDALIGIMAANVTMTVNGFLRTHPDINVADVLEPAILDAYRMGHEVTAEDYGLAINRFHAIGRTLDDCLRTADFILTPTLMRPPARLGELSMDDDFRSFRRKIGHYTTFLAIINASGQPAASVPLWTSCEGLPIGTQLIAPFGAEADLLRLCAALEAADPWQARLATLQLKTSEFT